MNGGMTISLIYKFILDLIGHNEMILCDQVIFEDQLIIIY